jgi:hypothetical protein
MTAARRCEEIGMRKMEATKPHRFIIGQQVNLAATRFERILVAGSFEIIARLPSEAGEPQYRVKNGHEAFERRVGEHRLTPAF